jgi:hypothetical protein
MILWESGFSYAKPKFPLNGGYAKLHEETVHHLKVKQLLYISNYRNCFHTNKHNYKINNTKLIFITTGT